ncbi:MAG: Mur ligase family protein [Candidatus Gastranaerophilales bacterium]|nr:Mur ligase family protein [Candidatus Gastranaerophilales bacterium]
MADLKYYTALIAAKTATTLIKILGKSKATSAPGMLAMKISKDFIHQAAKNNREKIITVTGTNGKTTTTGLLAHIVKTSGKRIIHNTEGANMLTGVATALVQKTKFFQASDYLIFESDEAYLQKLYDFINADYLLVTNLFRDQLDRYGELDITYRKIKEAIDKNDKLTVFINADDPTLENIASKNKKIYFGVNSVEFAYELKDSLAPAENTSCPLCSVPLEYEKRFYAHIGHYVCKCGYKRTQPEYSCDVKVYDSYSELTIHFGGKEASFTVNMPGLYNVYNALGAISAALEIGIDEQTIQKALSSYSSVFGRAEMTTVCGKKTLIQLIKNPVGASEVIRQIQGFEKSKLVVILNDDYADGRDVSWIWDADFEVLQSYGQKIIVSGTRANDAALRLKYAGVNTELITVVDDIETAVSKAAEMTADDETLLILPTYTALLKMQTFLSEMK